MREILFRGKRLDNDEWIEGFYRNPPSGLGYITRWIVGQAHTTAVYAITVGQYTGLKDKNGKRIFEGDILRVYFHWWNPLESRWEEKSTRTVVAFDQEKALFVGLNVFHIISREVIGNIYDNPELLKGE